jgi:hypothetical protein
MSSVESICYVVVLLALCYYIINQSRTPGEPMRNPHLRWRKGSKVEGMVEYSDDYTEGLAELTQTSAPAPVNNNSNLQWQCATSDNPYSRDGSVDNNGQLPEGGELDDSITKLMLSKVTDLPVVGASPACHAMANITQSHGSNRDVSI